MIFLSKQKFDPDKWSIKAYSLLYFSLFFLSPFLIRNIISKKWCNGYGGSFTDHIAFHRQQAPPTPLSHRTMNNKQLWCLFLNLLVRKLYAGKRTVLFWSNLWQFCPSITLEVLSIDRFSNPLSLILMVGNLLENPSSCRYSYRQI